MSIDNVTYQDVATISGGKLSDIKPEQREGALRGPSFARPADRRHSVKISCRHNGAAGKYIA